MSVGKFVLLVIGTLIWCIGLSMLLVYMKYHGSETPERLSAILGNSTQTELTDDRLLNLTYTPPYDEAA